MLKDRLRALLVGKAVENTVIFSGVARHYIADSNLGHSAYIADCYQSQIALLLT